MRGVYTFMLNWEHSLFVYADWRKIWASGKIQEECQTETKWLQSMIWFDHCPHHRCSLLVYCTNACLPRLWQKMIEEMTHRLVKLVRGALLPTTLPKSDQNLYGGWDNKTDLSGKWLTQIMHTVRLEEDSVRVFVFRSALRTFNDSSLVPVLLRACHEALSALEIPNDLLQVIQDLLLDLRVHCLMVTLVHTTEGEPGSNQLLL